MGEAGGRMTESRFYFIFPPEWWMESDGGRDAALTVVQHRGDLDSPRLQFLARLFLDRCYPTLSYQLSERNARQRERKEEKKMEKKKIKKKL